MSTIIGISGGTGSGKTTLAEAILARFAGASIALLHQDAYYRDLSSMSPYEIEQINFDHPSSIDNKLLAMHIKRLKNGKAVTKPVYDFKTHTRAKKGIRVEPAHVILIEGILIFEDKTIRDMLDIKVFMDMGADISFIRRLLRDTKERGRSMESVIEQYVSTVMPMHLEFVYPTKKHADIIVPEGGRNATAIDMLVSRIKSILAITHEKR